MASFRWGGRTWGPGSQKAFAAWLNKRGASFQQFAANHPDIVARTYPGVFDQALASRNPNPRLFEGALSARVNSMLAPERSAISAERARAQREAKQLIANNQGFTKALTEMLGSIGPGVQQGYEQAAGTIGALGKGFADQQVAQGSADAASAADFLGKAGMSQQAGGVAAAAGGQAAGDVLYGASGYIPATALAREGAAFGAAARHLPAEAAGLGQQSGRQIAQQAQEADLGFARELAALAAKSPGLRQEVLQSILENRRADEAMDVQKAYLGLSGAKFGHEVQQDAAELQLEQQEAAADAKVASSKNAAKGAQKREAEFAKAQASIHADAEDLGEVVEQSDPAKPWLPAKKVRKMPPYAVARKRLFDKYKHLLRFSTRSGRPALRRRLNQIIDEALAAQGIRPAPKPRPAPPGGGAPGTPGSRTPGR